MRAINLTFRDGDAVIHAQIDDEEILKQYCDRYAPGVDFGMLIYIFEAYPSITRLDLTYPNQDRDPCSCIDCETGCSEACEICMPEEAE